MPFALIHVAEAQHSTAFAPYHFCGGVNDLGMTWAEPATSAG